MKNNFLHSVTFWAILAPFLMFGGCKKSENPVIARAGTIKITEEDFSKELVNLPPTYQNYLSTLEGKKQFLDILLREKILLNAAERAGITRKKEIQTHLKEYKEQAKEQEKEFKKSLILREYLRELQDGDLKVTDAELKLYYDQNTSDFQNPKKVTASHILLPSQEEAEKAYARIKKGEDFAKVAREMSADPSAMRGGMIGEVSRGDLTELPEFEKELFSLKTGQTSNIIKTKIGYHIVKKNGEITLPSQSYEQAVPQIRRLLEKKKFDQWIEKEKNSQKVWIDEKALTALPTTKPEPSSDAASSKIPETKSQ